MSVAFRLLLSSRSSSSLISIYSPAQAKNKKKQQLPDVVLNAQRVLVVIRPDAAEPLTNPRANSTAQDEVERAISKWHRFDLVMESTTADLVIAVSKGHTGGPIISKSPWTIVPSSSRPSPARRASLGVRIGAQQGRPPDLTESWPGTSGQRATARQPDWPVGRHV